MSVRERIQQVVEELNLDTRDPFTHVFAVLAGKHEELTALREREKALLGALREVLNRGLSHGITCPYGMDTGWPHPCKCGAEKLADKLHALLAQPESA